MKRTMTVKENYEFRRIYAKGRSGVSPYLVVYVRPNRRGRNRLGVTVSTKLGHAVVRNRVRRRLREIFRLNQGEEAVKRFLLALVRFYRKSISPLRPPCCRFIPTCSQYALEAIEKYGALKGGWLAFKRIMRCHPFYRGGKIYDPVP